MAGRNSDSVRITLSEPVVVARSPPGLDRAAAGWGRWQFPCMDRLADGRLHVSFSIEPDSAESNGKPLAHAYSTDDGVSWRAGAPRPGHDAEEGVLLPNGDRLKTVQLPSRRAEELDLPGSACDFVCSYGYPRSLYRAADLPAELAGWRFRRLAAGGGRWVEEAATMRIPGELRCVTLESSRGATPGVGGIAQVKEGPLALPCFLGKMRVAPDGSLWAATYDWRLSGGSPRYAPMFLRSVDNGRSWDLCCEIRYQGDAEADPQAPKRDGFTEPAACHMPDGSVICLMRTMDGNGHGPLYLARSTDHCRTWSSPVIFDGFGKMPCLLALGKGLTLAAYGASGGPGHFAVRATVDPAGLDWQEPVRTAVSPVEPGAWDTCGHTDMVALNDHSALIVYSDFNFPDARGGKGKSILARRIEATARAA